MISLTLFMIVRNESAIITRCLDSIKNQVDYIVITDTGSTDNTVNIINQYLVDNKIKGKVYQEEWKNFGYNRTKSIENAQNWLDEQKIDKSYNYLLTIDADMILIFSDKFKKTDLQYYDQWLLYQYNNLVKWYNSRIFKASLPFKCIGVTHEYWGCDEDCKQSRIDTLYINDKGDGGCKSNKFSRDIELLKKGLEDEPDNYRYYFYLAQSYGDSGDHDNAIKWYNKRIDAKGWDEEIFISYKRIGDFYMEKGEEEKAIYNWTRAYECLPSRSESLYKICNFYRNKGHNYSSLMYIRTGIKITYPQHLVLFLQYPIYKYKFIEELSIIAFYTNKRKEGLLSCQYLLLNSIKDNIPEDSRQLALQNNFFYINSIPHIENIKLSIPTREPYISSTPCIHYNKNSKTYKGIIRCVNYSITDNFQYKIRDPNEKVSTINYWVEFDHNFNIITSYEINCNTKKLRSSHIEGMEDMRICMLNNKLYGFAVDFEHGEKHLPSIILTHFELKDEKYTIEKTFPVTYKNNICQKNWTLFTENFKMYAIYSHHPLTILEINHDNGNYKVVKEKYSEYNLSDIRGSSNPIKIGKEWLVLVHEVVHKNTRKYYHRFLKYSSDWNLLEISEPFYFQNLFVEFSLSIIHNDNKIIIFYSSRDNTSEAMTIEYSKIPWLPKDIKEKILEIL